MDYLREHESRMEAVERKQFYGCVQDIDSVRKLLKEKQFYECVQDIDSVRKLLKENNSMDVSKILTV